MGQSLAEGYDLIITNGDAAGELIRKAIHGTEVLPWRDVLHDGPVPLTEDHEELSEIRADYLADKGWGLHEELRESFRARDRGIAHHAVFEKVSLWFEHDLYDQLQLIQILSWFADHEREKDSLRLMQTDRYLGYQSPKTLAGMQEREQPVTSEHIGVARRAWDAYRQPNPADWAGLLDEDLAALPFLKASVQRSLEELPDLATGLPRTEWSMLDRIAEGVTRPPALFGAVERMEEAPFMGDWSFWDRLDQLASEPAALVAGLEGAPFAPDRPVEQLEAYFKSDLALTELGRAVLEGQEDYCDHAGPNLWLGGTHVTHESLWRWNRQDGRLFAPN